MPTPPVEKHRHHDPATATHLDKVICYWNKWPKESTRTPSLTWPDDILPAEGDASFPSIEVVIADVMLYVPPQRYQVFVELKEDYEIAPIIHPTKQPDHIDLYALFCTPRDASGAAILDRWNALIKLTYWSRCRFSLHHFKERYEFLVRLRGTKQHTAAKADISEHLVDCMDVILSEALRLACPLAGSKPRSSSYCGCPRDDPLGYPCEYKMSTIVQQRKLSLDDFNPHWRSFYVDLKIVKVNDQGKDAKERIRTWCQSVLLGIR